MNGNDSVHIHSTVEYRFSVLIMGTHKNNKIKM